MCCGVFLVFHARFSASCVMGTATALLGRVSNVTFRNLKNMPEQELAMLPSVFTVSKNACTIVSMAIPSIFCGDGGGGGGRRTGSATFFFFFFSMPIAPVGYRGYHRRPQSVNALGHGGIIFLIISTVMTVRIVLDYLIL